MKFYVQRCAKINKGNVLTKVDPLPCLKFMQSLIFGAILFKRFSNLNISLPQMTFELYELYEELLFSTMEQHTTCKVHNNNNDNECTVCCLETGYKESLPYS